MAKTANPKPAAGKLVEGAPVAPAAPADAPAAAPVAASDSATTVAQSPAAPAVVDSTGLVPGLVEAAGLWTVYGQSCQAAVDVLKERCRQVEEEGFTTDTDDTFTDYQLPRAAVCYAINAAGLPPHRATLYWPFPPGDFKPTLRRANLVKAAALLLAEIERLDRAELAA
ncbi:hypothetical protein HER21_28600 [Pseudomonas sp. BGM005]|nr:hypothetical protein [Pseudomonas sp. BG5]